MRTVDVIVTKSSLCAWYYTYHYKDIILSIEQIRKQRCREINQIAQGQRTSKLWKSTLPSAIEMPDK